MTTGARTEGLRGIGSNGFIRTVANLTVTGDLVVLGENRALAGTGSFSWEAADANAEYWAFELPTGTSEHVPVLGVGVGLDGVDLGLFDGVTQPTLAVIDADRDSFLAMDFQADDVARLATNAATLRVGIGGNDEIVYTSGALEFQQATTISPATGVLALDGASGSGIRLNEAGIDCDFAVETEDVINFFFVDAALNSMGINGTALSQSLLTFHGMANASNNVAASENGLAMLIGGGTWYLANSSSTLAVGALISIPPITLANDTATLTYTNWAQVYIGGGPTAGANVTLTNAGYGFWSVPSIRLDSSLWVEGTPTEGSAGEQLTSGGTGAVMTWAAAGSQREVKQDIERIEDHASMLQDILDVPNYRWKYDPDKRGNTGDFDTLYVGPMADEAPWAMHHDGRILNPISTFGYTVSAIKALAARIQALEDGLVRR